jgi:hypothetical protein
MKLKTKEVHREYRFTDVESKRLIEEAIRQSQQFIRALTDDQ